MSNEKIEYCLAKLHYSRISEDWATVLLMSSDGGILDVDHFKPWQDNKDLDHARRFWVDRGWKVAEGSLYWYIDSKDKLLTQRLQKRG